MTIKTQGGLVLTEYQCSLPRDHPGHHRSKEGVVWKATEKASKFVEGLK